MPKSAPTPADERLSEAAAHALGVTVRGSDVRRMREARMLPQRGRGRPTAEEAERYIAESSPLVACLTRAVKIEGHSFDEAVLVALAQGYFCPLSSIHNAYRNEYARLRGGYERRRKRLEVAGDKNPPWTASEGMVGQVLKRHRADTVVRSLRSSDPFEVLVNVTTTVLGFAHVHEETIGALGIDPTALENSPISAEIYVLTALETLAFTADVEAFTSAVRGARAMATLVASGESGLLPGIGLVPEVLRARSNLSLALVGVPMALMARGRLGSDAFDRLVGIFEGEVAESDQAKGGSQKS